MSTENIHGFDLYCETTHSPRPMVPVELREVIIQTFHALGHPNAKETTRRISEFYYWPKLKSNVEQFVSTCHPCQSVKPGKIRPELGKFPLPDKRFANVHVDVVGPLPESRGFTYLLSVMDRSSRHYECIPMKEATSATRKTDCS